MILIHLNKRDFSERKRYLNKLAYMSISLLTIALLNTGCTKLGPNFSGIDHNVSYDFKVKDTRDNKEISQWWKNFNDETLNTLVDKTYKQNLDLQSAGLRILQARAVLGISEGLLYPQKQTLSGNALANRNDGNGFGNVGVNFDIGWEMDIWGKYARGIESSEATLFASLASYNDIMISVIAEMARNYVNYRTAQERMAYAIRNVTLQEYVTKITKIQFNTGNVSELDMQQSLAQLHSTKSALPTFKLAMIKARNAMAILIGTTPIELEKLLKKSLLNEDKIGKYLNTKNSYIQIKDANDETLNLSIIPSIDFNPDYAIDAKLLKNRPDLKVAEYIAHSNSANIGLSTAELYPSFTLLGTVGINTNNPDGSWSSPSDSIGVSIGPAFSWNIFQYDRIKNKIRLQDAIFEESLLSYNKKLLQAIGEISDALYGYKFTKEQQEENEKAVNATVRAFNISMIQYNDGLVGYQRLLSSVEKLTRDQDRYAQVKGSLCINAIALYKALGGGWQMSKGQSYISKELADKMSNRTDWDTYLDDNNTNLPKEMP